MAGAAGGADRSRAALRSFRTATAEGLARGARRKIQVETVTLPAAAGVPAGRKFGRVVHDMLQQRGAVRTMSETLAAIWGRRHGAGEVGDARRRSTAARAALAHPAMAVPEARGAIGSCR